MYVLGVQTSYIGLILCVYVMAVNAKGTSMGRILVQNPYFDTFIAQVTVCI